MDPKYIIEIQRLDVTTGEFVILDELRTWKSLQFSNKLNGIGSCRFELAVQDQKATRSNLVRFANHIAVKRNGALVWFGPITDINIAYENVSGYLTIEANTYLFHLNDRYSDKSKIYPEQNICAIATDLIDTIQARDNGDLLIVVPSTPTSIDRPRTLEYKQVSRELIELSNLIGGFDFSFDPVVDLNGVVTQINFNMYPNRLGSVRTDLQHLELGRNVRSIRMRTEKSIYNNSIVEGAGTGTETITSELPFGASQQAYTRREVVLALKDAQLSTTLSDFNEVYLNQVSVEKFVIDLELYQDKMPQFGDYSLGDTLIVDSEVVGNSDGYLNFAGKRGRVEEIIVRVDDQGAEYLTPRLLMYE